MIDHSYLDLLIVNYFQDKEDLKDLIIEKYNIAKDNHISSERFFKKCYAIINILIKYIDLDIEIQKAELRDVQSHSQNEQRKKDIQDEIDLIERDGKGSSSNYPFQERSVNLSKIKNCSYSGIIKYSQILEIKEAINEALIEVGKVKTLLSICNESELKEIRKILIKENIISNINEADFLHHFTGQLMDESISKIGFLPVFKENAKRKNLYDIVIHLVDREKKTLNKEDFIKIAYSFIDKKINKIQLKYNDKQFTSNFDRQFKDICDQAKKRLNK